MSTALYTLAGIYSLSLLVRYWLSLSYAKRLPPLPSELLPPNTLTIVQAILSGDPLLEARLVENLNTLKGQTFLWLIDEDDTEAQHIAEKLKRPDLHVKLCTPCPDATNPKLWKLMAASPLIKTAFFAVIDDDTTLPASSATALVEAAKTHTVATGLPCYLSHGCPSHLLAQFVNNNSAFTYLGTSRLLPPFTLNGMGYVMRAEMLECIEHFKPILHELTDDLALATLVLKQGGTIHQSAAPLHVQTGVRNLKHYWQMMHRWYVFTLLLLRRQSISSQMAIFLLHGLPPMLLVGSGILFVAAGKFSIFSAAIPVVLCILEQWIPRSVPIAATVLGGALLGLAAVLPPLQGEQVLLFLLSVRIVILEKVQARFFRKALHRPFTSLLSELIQPLHLVHALCCRTIRWRTRLYRVRDTNDFSAA